MVALEQVEQHDVVGNDALDTMIDQFAMDVSEAGLGAAKEEVPVGVGVLT